MCESKELQISVSPRKSTRLSDKKKALERPGIFDFQNDMLSVKDWIKVLRY